MTSANAGRPLTLEVLPPPPDARPALPVAARCAPDAGTELDADITALSHADREALRFVGRTVSQMLVWARRFNVVPLSYLLLWPVLMPWLLAVGARMQAVRSRPALKKLREKHAHVVKGDLVDDRKVMLQNIDDEDRRAFLALRYVPLCNVVAWCLPPLILAAALALGTVLGRSPGA